MTRPVIRQMPPLNDSKGWAAFFGDATIELIFQEFDPRQLLIPVEREEESVYYHQHIYRSAVLAAHYAGLYLREQESS